MGHVPQFTSEVASREGVASIALRGELDMATVPLVEAHMARFEGDGFGAIILDLRELSFLDCSALHAFVVAWDRAKTNGHRLILVGANSFARRLFELTDTGFLLADEAAADYARFIGGPDRPASMIAKPYEDADV